MTEFLECIDDFCIGVIFKNKVVHRYEWIISSDFDEFHSCHAGFKTLSYQCGKNKVIADKFGIGKRLKNHDSFNGIVNMKCEKCHEHFKVQYSEACDNPEIIDIDSFKSGNW